MLAAELLDPGGPGSPEPCAEATGGFHGDVQDSPSKKSRDNCGGSKVSKVSKARRSCPEYHMDGGFLKSG